MSIKQYFKNLSLLLFINLAIKPIWIFGVERKFQIWLGQEEYGKYFSFLSLIYILSVLLDLGLHSYSVKFISEKKDDLRIHLSEIWWSKWILVVVYLLVVFGFIFVQNLSLSDAKVFILIAMEMLTFSLYQFLRCFAQGLQLHRLDSFLSSLDRILLILLGGGILWLFSSQSQINLTWFVLFHILAYCICFGLVYWHLYTQISFQPKLFSKQKLLQIIQNGWQLTVIIFLMCIYTRIDAVMLRYLLPDGNLQCGELAYSHRLVDSAYNVLSLLGVFLFPTVARLYSEGSFRQIQKIVFISFLIASILAIGFILISWLYGIEIYHRLYPKATEDSVQIFILQSKSVLGVAWMYVFGSYLAGIGKFKQLIYIVSIGVVMSLGLNYYLIPILKAHGVAISCYIVQMMMGFLHLVVALYYLRINTSSTLSSTSSEKFNF